MGNSHTLANTKWKNANYDRFSLQLPKGEKERIRAYAERNGMTMTSYILALVRADMRASKQASERASE